MTFLVILLEGSIRDKQSLKCLDRLKDPNSKPLKVTPVILAHKERTHREGCCEIDKMIAGIPLVLKDVGDYDVYSTDSQISIDAVLGILDNVLGSQSNRDGMLQKNQ